MSKFKVGDICIIHSLRYDTQYNGCECSILEVNNPKEFATHGTLKGMSLAGSYRVDMVDDEGVRVTFLEYNLKLKKFDGEDKVKEMFKEILTGRLKEDIVEAVN